LKRRRTDLCPLAGDDGDEASTQSALTHPVFNDIASRPIWHFELKSRVPGDRRPRATSRYSNNDVVPDEVRNLLRWRDVDPPAPPGSVTPFSQFSLSADRREQDACPALDVSIARLLRFAPFYAGHKARIYSYFRRHVVCAAGRWKPLAGGTHGTRASTLVAIWPAAAWSNHGRIRTNCDAGCDRRNQRLGAAWFEHQDRHQRHRKLHMTSTKAKKRLRAYNLILGSLVAASRPLTELYLRPKHWYLQPPRSI